MRGKSDNARKRKFKRKSDDVQNTQLTMVWQSKSSACLRTALESGTKNEETQIDEDVVLDTKTQPTVLDTLEVAKEPTRTKQRKRKTPDTKLDAIESAPQRKRPKKNLHPPTATLHNDDSNDKGSHDLQGTLHSVKFFNLQGMHGGVFPDPATFWCRINVCHLITNKACNVYNDNTLMYCRFVVDTNTKIDAFEKNYECPSSTKLWECSFAQLPNRIFNTLSVHFAERNLVYTVMDYLPFADLFRKPHPISSLRVEGHADIFEEGTEVELLSINHILIASECVFAGRTHICDLSNNQSYVCGAYGGVDKSKLLTTLRAISNITAYKSELAHTDEVGEHTHKMTVGFFI